MATPILLDIMIDGRFVCQLRYTHRGFPTLVGGVVKEVHDADNLRQFVEQQRPSLRDKKYTIAFTDQKI